MNTQPRRWSRLSIALSLLLFAAACLLLLVLNAARRQQTGQVEPPQAQVALDSPLPTPVPPSVEMIVITPPPDGGVIVLPPAKPGQVYAFPSPTPIPTWTPRPTPTRRPGPTATAMPLAKPANTAAGAILFTTSTDSAEETIGRLPVDAQGQKTSEVTAISLSRDLDPYLIAPSPDEQHLLFMRSFMPGGLPNILDTKSGQIWPLFSENSYLSGRFFGWHPDSQRVLFWPSNSELWLIDIQTRQRTVLTFVDGAIQGAAISPDGQNVVYISRSKTAENFNPEAMWMVNTAGSDAHSLFYFDGSAYVFSWSPDGNYILYMGGPGAGREQTIDEKYASRGPLWLVNPSGQNPRPLTGSFVAGYGYEPAWSPDSQWIAFTGLDNGQEYGCYSQNKDAHLQWPECQFQGTGVYIENITSGEIRRLASGISPVWSPDGFMLAFLSNRSGATEIWTVHQDGAELRQLTTDTQPKTRVTWTKLIPR